MMNTHCGSYLTRQAVRVMRSELSVTHLAPAQW